MACRSKIQLLFESVKVYKETLAAVKRHKDKTGVQIYMFVDIAIKEKLARESADYQTKVISGYDTKS